MFVSGRKKLLSPLNPPLLPYLTATTKEAPCNDCPCTNVGEVFKGGAGTVDPA